MLLNFRLSWDKFVRGDGVWRRQRLCVCVSRVAQKDVRVARPEIGEENERVVRIFLEKLTPNWVVGDEQEFLRHGLKNKHKKWILVEKKNKTRWKNYGMKQHGVFRKLQL